MRKEIIVATFVGIFFGLFVAFGIWRANAALNTKNEPNPPLKTANNQPTANENGQILAITIANPEELDVLTLTPARISGLTRPNIPLVISGETSDLVLLTKNDGSFDQEVSLASGVNQILIKVFDEEGKVSEQKMTLAYSSEFEKDLRSDPSNKDSSPSSATISQVVEEKIEKASLKPKAYIGTMTDKTQDSLQIKNVSGEIQLISINEGINFINVGKTSKVVTFNDLAIGDFVVAMGLANGNGVLDAKRVLVTQPIQPPERHIAYGEIIKIERNTLSLKERVGGELTLTFPRRWKGPEIKAFNEGDAVIVVYSPVEEKPTIRTIEKVSNLTN